MVKQVKDKVVELVKDAEKAVAPKIQNLKITFNAEALWDVRGKMKARGFDVADDFEGPDFKDIMGYQLGNEWLVVSIMDGTSYVYPASSIARIKLYFTDKE